ncbi:MAG: hypothetical protein KJ579_03735 [Verrucomicrobia bacterium]|nr:hypothetical protein [Verrucomicrobiota bacterium]
MLDDLVSYEMYEAGFAKETGNNSAPAAERRLAKAVAAFIEKGLDGATLTNLTEAVRHIKMDIQRTSTLPAPSASSTNAVTK